MLKSEQQFYTTAELAARWHEHAETIRRRLREGQLTFVLIGRKKLISLDEIIRFEAAATIEATESNAQKEIPNLADRTNSDQRSVNSNTVGARHPKSRRVEND